MGIIPEVNVNKRFGNISLSECALKLSKVLLCVRAAAVTMGDQKQVDPDIRISGEETFSWSSGNIPKEFISINFGNESQGFSSRRR